MATHLHEVVLLEVGLQDRVLHRREHEADVLGVCKPETVLMSPRPSLQRSDRDVNPIQGAGITIV